MNKKILLWGGGNKAILAIKLFNLKNIIIFDPYIEKPNLSSKIPFFNKSKDLKKILKLCSSFFVCIGNNNGEDRSIIAENLILRKLKPINLIHKKSIIHKSSKIGKMVMVMPGVVINPNSQINDFCVINTSAVIEHDCNLENGAEIMGSASLAGGCLIKKNATVGTNATIFPNIVVNENSYVGGGSVVIKNVKKNDIVVGNPARYLKKNIRNKKKLKETKIIFKDL
tara:strand:- start:1072 stop:1749 length:678 start_codon:yes stop_codon:yes gene_type:complete